MTDHVTRNIEDLAPVPRFKRVCLADNLDDFRLEFLLSSKEAFPQVVADLALLEEGGEGGFGVADGPDELYVVHCAAEERGDEERSRGRGVEGEERDVDVAGLVLGEPWLGGGLLCTTRRGGETRRKVSVRVGKRGGKRRQTGLCFAVVLAEGPQADDEER